MKRLINKIQILFGLFLITSCSNSSTETTADKNYFERGKIENGVKVGEWQYYFYEYGSVVEGSYENGVKQGHWKYHYYRYGLTEIIPFKDGDMTGERYDVFGLDTVEIKYMEKGRVKWHYLITDDKDTINGSMHSAIYQDPYADQTKGKIE